MATRKASKDNGLATEKKSHGGARPGSGRPPTRIEPYRNVTAELPESLIAWLDAQPEPSRAAALRRIVADARRQDQGSA